MRRCLVFDTETTGFALPSAAELKSQPKIIEIGLVVLEGHKEVGAHSWLINPGEMLTPEIIKVTGLTDADLKGKPAFVEILPELIEVFVGARMLVAHNLPFDLSMLTIELRRVGKEHAFPYPPEQLCTVSAYNHVKGHNLKLIDLYQKVLGKELKQTHRALDDARALAEIVVHEQLNS